MNFSTQNIWITGASSGIGEHLAYALAERGARLLLSARTKEKLEEVHRHLSGNHQHHILPLDVAEVDVIPSKVREALAIMGHIDVLINNAGVSQRAPAEDTDIEVDRRIFEVNFFGNIALTKALLPHWLDRGNGRVVVVSSVAGKLGPPFRSAYAGSKHALHGWYDAFRAETADRGVHVNVVCPGYIHTNISINALNAKGEKHGLMDKGQAKGMSAQKCALKIIRAIEKDLPETVIGKEWLFVAMRRYFPGLYYSALRKRARKGQF